MKKKKEKKLRKDLLTAVSTPLALGLKLIITRNAPMAAIYKEAIMLRAKAPNKATFNSILKDEDALNWDWPMVMSAVLALYETEIINAQKSGKADKAIKLDGDCYNVLKSLVKDSLPIKPNASRGKWESVLQEHPKLSTAQKVFEAQRQSSLHVADNMNKCINYQMGICHDYYFAKCDKANCPKLHACLMPHDTLQYHKARFCPLNTAKAKRAPTKRSTAWKARGGFGYRGRSRPYYYGPQYNDRGYDRGSDRGYDDRYNDRGYDRPPNSNNNRGGNRRTNRERFNNRR